MKTYCILGVYMSEQLYTISEVSEMLKAHPDTIRAWNRDGKIKSIRIGNGWRRFPQSEIDRILGV